MGSAMSSKITVATRKSSLALAQCRAWIAELLRQHPGLEVRELHVTTSGDRIQDRSLADIGGKGLFVKEIEEAILAGEADIAVHSLKDVPPELLPSLVLSCFPRRADARDVVVTRTGGRFEELPSGSRVGTSSLRRMVQLRALRPDLEFLPVRGNVDTRLGKCERGDFEAIVLARAGLERLGLAERATETLSPDLCLPAVGQGALAIEQRADDAGTLALLAPLQDLETALAVHAERGVMTAVQGNCQTPVAAFAERSGDQMRLRAMLSEPDGSNLRRADQIRAWPASLEEATTFGIQVGATLKL
jgi:hydroxymethylbilane synthase